MEMLKKYKIENYLEYVLMILVVISTRSVFAHTDQNIHLNILFILLLFLIIAIKIIKKQLDATRILRLGSIAVIYYIYLIIFMMVNKINDLSNFISTFGIIFPLIFIRYYTDKDNYSMKNTLRILSDIICILSVISLFIYIIGPVIGLINPTNTVYLEWGNKGNINSYFNLSFSIQRTSIMGLDLPRNTGIFTEAPMYALNLIIALIIQLFIIDKPSIKKIILLTISIITTYTAIGIATATASIIIFFFVNREKYNNKKNLLKKIIISVISIMLIVGSIYIFVERKTNTESYSIRTDDFKACFLAWLEAPIFGNGYQYEDAIINHMSNFRMHNVGVSNSILTLLAESGIYLFIFYAIPTIYLIIDCIKNKSYKLLAFILIVLVLFVTTIFEYNIIMMYFLVFMYLKISTNVSIKRNRKIEGIQNFVITHKKFKAPEINGYTPIQVGAEGKEKIGYITDNTGENISSKNENYCELTGLYWIWKNHKESSIVGISHYRRYFSKSEIIKSEEYFLKQTEIERILKRNDIILPKKEVYKETAYNQYCNSSGFSSDLEKVKNIIKGIYPDYLDAYEEVMNQNKMYQYNMLICKKELYDSFCEWLFNILFELEKDTDLSKYNDYQKRIYGFLAERLLNVWVKKNNLKVKEIKVVNTEQNIKEIIRTKLRRTKNRCIFIKNKIGSKR